MKVLIFANPYPQLYGGGKRSYEVIMRLSKYDIEPTVVVDNSFARGRLNLDLTVPSIEVSHVMSYKDRILSPLKHIAMVLNDPRRVVRELLAKDEVPDLVVSHHEDPPFILASRIVASKLHLPWTAVLQSSYSAFRLSGRERFSFRNPIQVAMQPFSLKVLSRTTAILSVSPSVLPEMGCRLNCICLDPPVGVDHELISAAKDFGNLFDCAYCSRLTPEKGVFDILHIWHYVVKRKPEARLAIMGKFQSESIRSRFCKLLKRLRLEKKVTHLGFLERKKMFAYLKSSKLMIYPSRVDAFSLAILESLACGLPVVAYSIPSVRLNFHTDSVLKIPKGDIELTAETVNDLLRHEQKRRRLSHLAADFSRRFTWDLAAKSEANAYAKILEDTCIKNSAS